MKIMSHGFAALAVASTIGFSANAFAGSPGDSNSCYAQIATFKADGAHGVSIVQFNLDKVALAACTGQRQMANDGSRFDEESYHHRSSDVTLNADPRHATR